MKVVLKNVRLAFPALHQMDTPRGEGKPAYGARFIVPPEHPAVPEIRKALKQAAAQKWPGENKNGSSKADAVLAAVKGDKQKMCWFEREYTNDDGDVYDGFEGMFHLGSKSQNKPLIIDRDRTPLEERSGRPYSGCYVNATVEFWAQDNEHGKALRCQVTGVQFVRDGDSFGGGKPPAALDDFEDLADVGEDENEFA